MLKLLLSKPGSNLQFYSGDAWDFERKARSLKIVNTTRDIWLSISQKDDLSIELDGELYFNNVKLTISDAVVRFGGAWFSNIKIMNGYAGLMLPFTEWAPVGHVRCHSAL